MFGKEAFRGALSTLQNRYWEIGSDSGPYIATASNSRVKIRLRNEQFVHWIEKVGALGTHVIFEILEFRKIIRGLETLNKSEGPSVLKVSAPVWLSLLGVGLRIPCNIVWSDAAQAMKICDFIIQVHAHCFFPPDDSDLDNILEAVHGFIYEKLENSASASAVDHACEFTCALEGLIRQFLQIEISDDEAKRIVYMFTFIYTSYLQVIRDSLNGGMSPSRDLIPQFNTLLAKMKSDNQTLS